MDEPNGVLRWAMYHFAGGDAYLLGLLTLAVCQAALLRYKGLRIRRWLKIGSGLGLIWSLADPSPLPLWLMAVFLVVLVIRLVDWWRDRKGIAAGTGTEPWHERRNRMCLVACAVLGIGCEVPHFGFQRPQSTITTLGIIGDSITAGLNDGDDTWPRQLSRQVGTRILDASQPGATLKSACNQVARLASSPQDLLLLEIGGNDLLEGLPVAEFERDLDHLLSICEPSRRPVYLVELPIPPLSVRYGEVQRRVAGQHGVRLIPRRPFLKVLTTAGSTVDGIHLSNTGHARLASLIESLIPLSHPNPGTEPQYRQFEPKRLIP